MAGPQAAFSQILLVIILGTVESGSRGHFTDDRPAKAPRLIHLFKRNPRSLFLLRGVEKYRRAVLHADIWPLSIARRGIVILPEDAEEFVVRHLARVVGYLHHFSVAGLSAAHVLIRRVLEITSEITNGSICYAWDIAKSLFYSPEAAGAKRGCLEGSYAVYHGYDSCDLRSRAAECLPQVYGEIWWRNGTLRKKPVNPMWTLPRSPEYFLDRLAELHRRVRRRMVDASASSSMDELSRVSRDAEGDTIFALDVHAENILEDFFSAWGQDVPLLVFVEGQTGDGGVTYPPDASREQVEFTCIVDPIDGTRGLMYQKRSAWILSAIAPPPRPNLPGLDEIVLAMQTELPTSRSHLSDVLWAIAGSGAHGETQDASVGRTLRTFQPRPSNANSLVNGFGTIVKFFSPTKRLAVEIEEQLLHELYGAEDGSSQSVFDDEYLSSGGQLYELMMGHDRFVADLRPFLVERTGGSTLCAHPYDLCTELIAREAGVQVVALDGGPLRYSLDIRNDCGWIGYANLDLRASIEPVLNRVLGELSE